MDASIARPWSLMNVFRSASSFLHVHRTRAHPVFEHHAFCIEVGESSSFLHIRQHGRVVHPEPAILSTTAPSIGEYLEERIFIDLVVTFAQTFRAILVGGSEAIVCFAAQPHEPVARPLHLEQTGRPLVICFARNTA